MAGLFFVLTEGLRGLFSQVPRDGTVIGWLQFNNFGDQQSSLDERELRNFVNDLGEAHRVRNQATAWPAANVRSTLTTTPWISSFSCGSMFG